ncbi:hypothetical protein [Methylomonas koyamae]|nr:hypothetical protein [Methylomonas koyamae]
MDWWRRSASPPWSADGGLSAAADIVGKIGRQLAWNEQAEQ